MRTISLEDVAGILGGLPENPRVVVSGNFATPHALLGAVDAALPSYRLHALNAQPGLPDREGVTLETAFVGPGMRKSPRLVYIPSRLSLVPRLFTATCPPDVVVIHTSAPSDGMLSLGIEVNILPAAIEAVRARGGIVIAQVNSRMPYTFGDAEIPLDLVDFGVEVDAELPSPGAMVIDDISATIGDRVATRVADGSTMQLGIGAVPDAVLSGLTGRRGLRVWSEMFSDGVLELDRAGALDTDATLVSSFLFGSPELYAWVDRNPRVQLLRTETTNEPSLIAKQPLMTSVNTALQVDLYAQANASRVKGQIFSGFGGQTDFIVGALHSPGGQAILALRSWHPKADVSTIVPMIEEPVTSFQASAIVTENGQAWIWGYDQRSQARHLIRDAAHPDVRDELWEEARALKLA
ncbi:MAG: acetyl-CoA hydrolase/transferase C-terminal domain-containing protein [Candidatus Nanopelagicales bacterium]